ncbi:MAG: MMPL family transporter [Thermoleophilaceae bacterium]
MQTPDNFTARVGRWSAQHRKKAIFGWLAFVLVSLFIGMNLVPQKEIDQNSAGPGESGQAAKALNGAFPDASTEQVLIQSKQLDAGDRQFKAAVADVTQRLQNTKGVDDVVGPYDGAKGQISADGHSVLVDFELPGDSDVAKESVVNSLATVAAAQKAHPELRIEEMGDESLNKAVAEKSGKEMSKSMLFSLPLTLLILAFAFGALVAAGIPVLLALTSVAATLGLLGPISQIAPVDGSVMHVVLLVGMAVGVDYSLFYLKREREERAAGRDKDAAIEAAAATSGRAVLISGFTVMVAMAGMYLGGISNFASFATGTIMVVAVAVIGSLTVLPALLSKLGDRVDKGRLPLIGRIKNRVGEAGIWSRILDRVLRRPLLSAVVAASVLVALAVPAIGMQTSLGGIEDNSRDLPVMQTYDRIQAAFPSEGSMELVVVKADDVTAPKVVSAIESLEDKAAKHPGLYEGSATLDVSKDQTVATLLFPTNGSGTDEVSIKASDTLRHQLVPATLGQVDGVEAYTTGEAAATGDFNDAMIGHLPYVFAFVLSAAFLLLLLTFRSLVIPIKAIVLNLLSVGTAYGLLVLVFQGKWAEGLLGFESNGAIASWLPLFLFVILFGLSMDYHVFILTRVREAFDRGMTTEDAVAHGIKSTAGVVTSAAIVMVAVFGMFALSSELQMKQMGIGLAAAILIDATIIRGVLLPATMKLLGDWNWWLPSKLNWLPEVAHEPEVQPASA